MKAAIKKLATVAAVAMALASANGAHATVLGNLNDGLDHTSSMTGYWSLFVNAGDTITVTARRLQPTDIWAVGNNGADGSGTDFVAGDDELGPNVGGPWGDPRFTFTAATSGEYSIGVFRCCSVNNFEQIQYFVSATGSSFAVPLPGTLALFGLGMAGLGWSRRKFGAAA